MAFRQCFLRPPELTKIVLPKVLQNFKFHLLAQGTEPKSFPHNIQCRTRPKGPHSIFFLLFCVRMGIEKSQRVPPFNFFRRCETFFKKNFSAVEENTLKHWCPFAIFEPWIWRRLGPVPACFLYILNWTFIFTRQTLFKTALGVECQWNSSLETLPSLGLWKWLWRIRDVEEHFGNLGKEDESDYKRTGSYRNFNLKMFRPNRRLYYPSMGKLNYPKRGQHQGDPLAEAMYGVTLLPLISFVKDDKVT